MTDPDDPLPVVLVLLPAAGWKPPPGWERWTPLQRLKSLLRAAKRRYGLRAVEIRPAAMWELAKAMEVITAEDES